jgi:hypothetical protein
MTEPALEGKNVSVEAPARHPLRRRAPCRNGSVSLRKRDEFANAA